MKCIHIDMDCFYAAIEERDNPDLKGKPIAVGGESPRSVLCTANYTAREHGCRSAMPSFMAKQRCPELIILPVRMDTYKAVSKEIRAIYSIFTEKIEPLSLDEAFLDVSHCNTQAAIIAKEIRQLIYERTALTSSAGIAPNKMLAKIASDWNKPNGQFEITEDQIDSFMYELPVTELWGVGKQSLKKLYSLDIQTCGDIQKYNKIELYQLLGNWGISLFSLSRGIDNRQVKSSRKTKSISKETTFSENIDSLDLLHTKLNHLLKRLEKAKDSPSNSTYKIKNNVIKLKFADFSQTTVERSSPTIHAQTFKKLLNEAWKRGGGKPVRLLGAGLRFSPPDPNLELGLDMGHS